jgi:hypothetical protein
MFDLEQEKNNQIRQDNQESEQIKLEKEVEQCIQYACKEGFLNPTDIEKWNFDEKYDYYKRCQEYEPPDEE